MQDQNYKNHIRFVPLFHFILYPLLTACLVGAVWNLNWALRIHHGRINAALVLGLAVAGLLTTLFSRTFSLKVQDRAIRAEENLRHFVLTGRPLDSRLNLSQVIALRFASDTEFVILAERAANENIKAADIKKAIVNWRGDYHRA